jgi:hypothetical protein
MRIQPRQQLLDIWRALARWSFPDQTWSWGGRDGRNSISDAEQLLCLLAPASEIAGFRLDRPDETAQDVLDSLSVMGDSIEIPRRLIRVMADYLSEYTDETGAPVFSGGGYFGSADATTSPSEAQRAIDVVDSYAMSVRLSLAIIGFVRSFRAVLTREALLREVSDLENMASVRLTAAMIGLLRSFAVNTFDASGTGGKILLRTVNQANAPMRRVMEELQLALRGVNAGLRDLTIGAGWSADLDNPNLLFECGWSWSVVQGAPQVEVMGQPEIRQPEGVALPAPYLYFTAVALDNIRSLFSERTRVLGLLNDEQQRLARLLQVRWDLAQSYWATIALFGAGRWALEDPPWRTTDEMESDYFTLLVASIVAQALSPRSTPDAELARVGRVLEDLAGRARVTRRPTGSDPAVDLHAPGVPIVLEGSESAGGPQLTWLITDFSPQLLKQVIRVADLLTTTQRRARMLDLSDAVWDHLSDRKHRNGAATGLWDEPSQLYPDVKPGTEVPSWHYTERVVECLVATAATVARQPLLSSRLTELAGDLLAEADHLFDQELVTSAEMAPAMSTTLQVIGATLRRAREVLPSRPATAAVLAGDALRELDRLAAARQSFREAFTA